MDRIKSAGAIVLWLAAVVVPILIAVVVIRGMAWVGDHIIGWTMTVAGWTIIVDLLLLLLAAFRTGRPFSAVGFAISAQVYMFAGVLLGFLTCWHLGGVIATIIGFVLGVIGLMPVGMIVAGFHGEWGVVGNIALLLGCWIAATAIGGLVAKKADDEIAAAP